MIQTISDAMPRLNIYEQLNDDSVLQTALINIYREVIEFSVSIFQYFNRRGLGENQRN